MKSINIYEFAAVMAGNFVVMAAFLVHLMLARDAGTVLCILVWGAAYFSNFLCVADSFGSRILWGVAVALEWFAILGGVIAVLSAIYYVTL